MELQLDSQMPFVDLKWVGTVDGQLRTATITINFTSYGARNYIRDPSKAREFTLKALNMNEFPDSFNVWPMCVLSLVCGVSASPEFCFRKGCGLFSTLPASTWIHGIVCCHYRIGLSTDL